MLMSLRKKVIFIVMGEIFVGCMYLLKFFIKLLYRWFDCGMFVCVMFGCVVVDVEYLLYVNRIK